MKINYNLHFLYYPDNQHIIKYYLFHNDMRQFQFYLYDDCLAKFQIFRTFDSGYSVKVCTLVKVQADYISPPVLVKSMHLSEVNTNHPFYILQNML